MLKYYVWDLYKMSTTVHTTTIQPSTHSTPSEFHCTPWTVISHKSHILPSKCANPNICSAITVDAKGDGPKKLCAFCRYDRILTLPSLPEMVFADNLLRLQHDKGFGIEFNALEALRLVDDKHDLMKVAVSQAWKEARADSEHIKDVVKPFDWTYTTSYKGTRLGAGKLMEATPTTEKIDLEKLKQREKILFYDDVQLYEDELADNGCSSCSVKIRVMPTSFFLLLRFYLRVDNVLVRINDTRLYHEFDKDYLLREYSIRESKISELKVPSSLLTDANEIWPHLNMKEERLEKLVFPVS